MRTGITLTFTETMKILGYTNFWPVNFIRKTLYLPLFNDKTTTEYFSAAKRN